MNFREAESYLFSLGNEVSVMKLGLDYIRTLVEELGRPHDNYLKVQIAGTNGKGSVCAFLDSICREAGIRTGLYTSPHLVSITERIKLNGEDISEPEFARFATVVRETSERLVKCGKLQYTPTYFEQVTAIALLAFAESEVELAILETGLGGRFDATTAAKAEIIGITQIDIDHQEYLGITLEEIAGEKAAILRPDVTAVIAEQRSEAMKVIADRIAKGRISARSTDEIRVTAKTELPESIIINEAAADDETFLGDAVAWMKRDSETFVFKTGESEYKGVTLGLAGRHQIENARVAVLLAEVLREHFEISDAAVVSGLRNAKNPGRLEFADGVLYDGAHNPAGVEALAHFLRSCEADSITLIFGAMEDKNAAAMAELLFAIPNRLIFTVVANSRGRDPREFLKYVPEGKLGECNVTESAADAINLARALAPESLIVVAGSLYLVGDVKKYLASDAGGV